jgi:hypothetical protein
VNAESVYHETDVKDEQPYIAAPETAAMAEPLAGPTGNGVAKDGSAAEVEPSAEPLAGTAER